MTTDDFWREMEESAEIRELIGKDSLLNRAWVVRETPTSLICLLMQDRLRLQTLLLESAQRALPTFVPETGMRYP